jgi:hypothetical protein
MDLTDDDYTDLTMAYIFSSSNPKNEILGRLNMRPITVRQLSPVASKDKIYTIM